MSDDTFMMVMFGCLVVICLILLGGGLYLAFVSEEQEGLWAAKCEQAGGVPSKYHTMVGKVSHDERLCIKKENVVEVER